jgi:hypothetical protein
LLVELLAFGRKLWGQRPSLATQSEAREFVRYVADVVDRGGRKRPLGFLRNTLRVGTVLVGERERAEAEGARPYVAAALWHMRAGCTTVFLLGRGARCGLVREVADQIERDGRVRLVEVTDYTVNMEGSLIPAVVARAEVEPVARSVWRPRRRPGVTAAVKHPQVAR